MSQLIRVQSLREELNSSKIFDKYLGRSLLLVKVDIWKLWMYWKMHSFKVILQVFYPVFRNTYSKVSTVYLFMAASIDWYTTKRNQVFNQEALILEILSLVKLLQYHIQIKDTLWYTKKSGVANTTKVLLFVRVLTLMDCVVSMCFFKQQRYSISKKLQFFWQLSPKVNISNFRMKHEFRSGRVVGSATVICFKKRKIYQKQLFTALISP